MIKRKGVFNGSSTSESGFKSKIISGFSSASFLNFYMEIHCFSADSC